MDYITRTKTQSLLDIRRECRLRHSIKRVSKGFGAKKKRKRRSEQIGVFEVSGGQSRNRTKDTRIFNPLLYQLS